MADLVARARLLDPLAQVASPYSLGRASYAVHGL
jgi:hypothetical protein